MVKFIALSVLALAVARPGWAVQSTGVGCNGEVAPKAGRSGPCTPLAQAIDALLADPMAARAHWGIDVIGMDGSPIYSRNEGQLFQPASNAKLFTTVTAMALLGLEKRFETRVIAEGSIGAAGVLKGDLVLKGGGDANFGSDDLPYRPPQHPPAPPPVPSATMADIEALADQVVAKGIHEIEGDVIGDDSAFSWQPIPPAWEEDDLLWGYGAPVSALTVHNNLIDVSVAPNAMPQQKAVVELAPAVPFYSVENSVLTVGAGHDCENGLLFERSPGSRVLTITGEIAPRAAPCREQMAIDDPAEYAAMALREALLRRGVHIVGVAKARHWEPRTLGSFLPKDSPEDAFLQKVFDSPHPAPLTCEAQTEAGPPAAEETVLATHESAPLIEDLTLTNKVSQNLHAELFLRHLGAAYGCQPTAQESLRVVRQYLLHAGLDKDDFVFYDGSGLSGHDLVTPRATVRLLQYASQQPWFTAWRSSLPVGGVDGSLASRFGRSPLNGRVWAKTGTLGEARALSGYVQGTSGRMVIFSVMSGNHLPGNSVDRSVMDRIVEAIAAAN